MTTLEGALLAGAPGAGSAMTAMTRTKPHTSTRGRVRTCPRTVFRDTRHASEAIICRPSSPGVRRTPRSAARAAIEMPGPHLLHLVVLRRGGVIPHCFDYCGRAVVR